MKRSKKKKSQKITLSVLRDFIRRLLDYTICLYLLLILVVMPFYFRIGYSYIGTDKAYFFESCGSYFAKVFVPMLAIYLLLALAAVLQSSQADSAGRSIESCIQYLWQNCGQKLSVTDGFASLYALSVLLSYLFTDYRATAYRGTTVWYMGLIPQLQLLSSFFLVSHFWKRRKWIFHLIFPVSAVVFVLGYLDRFGVYLLDMASRNPDFISTIGNINWYCGYLVSVFFAGFYLQWQGLPKEGKNSYFAHAKWRKYVDKALPFLLEFYVFLGFATLITQGSSSGIFALGVMFLVTFCMAASEEKSLQRFFQVFAFFSGACLFTWVIQRLFPGRITRSDSVVTLLTNSFLPIVLSVLSAGILFGLRYLNSRGSYPKKLFSGIAKAVAAAAVLLLILFLGLTTLNTLHPGSLGPLLASNLFTFSPDWGSNRGATWSAGLLCFRQQDLLHKLVGVGPDCMSAYIYQDGGETLLTLVRSQFGSLALTNAHNEWLTILVNTGLLGFASYIGIMVSAIYRFIKSRKSSLITGACGFCLLAYTVNNFFSFQQSMSAATIFVLLGIGEAMRREDRQRVD